MATSRTMGEYSSPGARHLLAEKKLGRLLRRCLGPGQAVIPLAVANLLGRPPTRECDPMRKLWPGVLSFILLPLVAPAQTEAPYPQGKAFPLGLYSIETLEEMQREQPHGWNIAHTYGKQAEHQAVVKQAGWAGLAHLAKAAEEETKAMIEALLGSGPVAWWDFPEEQRHWRADEYQIVKDLSAWTRKYDPQRHPNFMYLPGHYGAEAVAKYVPYLDIIGAGTYTEYAHMPRAWVRWRMEETIRGIALAGAKIGPDYLAGEKTPIGIPMLFYRDGALDIISSVEAYHDFYSCLAAGARGMLVFSYWHKRDADVLQKSYDAYAKGAAEVSGPEGLGQALLFGEDVPLTCEITDGPERTYAFRPTGLKEDVSFPSVNVLGKRHQGKLFVIAVNSSERPVKAKLAGLPEGVPQLRLPFEKAPGPDGKPTDQPRTVKVEGGVAEDSFGWLGVHVYVAP